ncbi:MAG TPA: hypothetical protein VK179_01695 [Bacteroidales bacterium]|nr:hypothetical protein [Bacteroidales bacterium]
MKTLFCLLSLLTAIPVLAQNSFSPMPLAIDGSTGRYSTTGVVHIDSMPGDMMMEAAFKWLSEVKFVNSLGSKGIITDEAFMKKISVNQYFMSSPVTFNSKVRFVLYLEFKDGRFRYRFTEFSYIGARKREFEEVETDDDKLLVGKFLLESNSYIKEFTSQFVSFLENYKPDDSW